MGGGEIRLLCVRRDISRRAARGQGRAVRLCTYATCRKSSTYFMYLYPPCFESTTNVLSFTLTFLIARQLCRVSFATAARGGLQTTEGPSGLLILVGFLLSLDKNHKGEC